MDFKMSSEEQQLNTSDTSPTFQTLTLPLRPSLATTAGQTSTTSQADLASPGPSQATEQASKPTKGRRRRQIDWYRNELERRGKPNDDLQAEIAKKDATIAKKDAIIAELRGVLLAATGGGVKRTHAEVEVDVAEGDKSARGDDVSSKKRRPNGQDGGEA